MSTNVDFGGDWNIVVVAVARVVPVEVHLWYQVEFPLIILDVWLDDECCQEVAQPLTGTLFWISVHNKCAILGQNQSSSVKKCGGVLCGGEGMRWGALEYLRMRFGRMCQTYV